MAYQWDFTPVFANADLLAQGLVNTLKVTGVSLACGLVLGLALALMRLSRHRLASWPAGFIIEVFRTTPPLVQLFWFFFALPLIVGIEMTPFLAACVTFSIQSAAFFAEVFRAGIQSIERGQWDGARALGMSWFQAMRRIILPQAIKRMMPALTNRAIEIFKMSTLASAVAYVELLQQGKLIASLNYNPIEAYTAVALIFFVFLWPLVQFSYYLERRLGRNE